MHKKRREKTSVITVMDALALAHYVKNLNESDGEITCRQGSSTIANSI